jgi:hypothetical protein
MIDLSKVAKTTLAGIGAVFRQWSKDTLLYDDAPEVPEGVRDAFMSRLAQGHFQPDVPAKRRLDLMTRYDFETRFREDG